MLLALLLSCDPEGLGECPSDPGGDPGVSRFAQRATDEVGDAQEGKIELFHDYETMNAWWSSVQFSDDLPEMDFSSSQAVGLVLSYLEREPEGDGEQLDGITWVDEDEGSLVLRISHECDGWRGEDPSMFWEVWVTPIVPVESCSLADCNE